MKHFTRLPCWFDVTYLRNQIEAHPELWNEHPNRTGFEGSPFAGSSDIWIRYRRREELVTAENFREPHLAHFYPAWHILTEIKPIAFDLMRNLEATYMGGILITRVPAGGQIKPHDDRGSWHAENLNTKVYIPIKANADCVNYCEDESTIMEVGTATVFDNLRKHAVVNNGKTDRWTLIICFQTGS